LGEPAKANRRALIVDEDEGNRLVLGRIARSAGYLVAFVSTARDAVAEIIGAAPDIIFTDIHLTRTDGFELINWLRRSSSAIPLIAMSGANAMLTGQLGLAARLGARATISKPLREADVLEAIRLANAKPRPSWPGPRGG
jgi:CheY-like chemotaxis protein